MEEKISVIRQSLIARLDENEILKCFIPYFMTNDWAIARYIEDLAEDKNLIIDKVTNCLKWRLEYKTIDFTIDQIPVEFARSGALIHCGKDKNDVNLVYIRYASFAALVNGSEKFAEAIKRLIAAYFCYLDRKFGVEGCAVIADFSGSGIYRLFMSSKGKELDDFVKAMFYELMPGELKYVYQFEASFAIKGNFN